MIARETLLKEISFVAIGADGATSASVAASNPTASSSQGKSTMFEKWLEAKGFDPTAITDAQKTSLRAMYDAEQAAKADAAIQAAQATTTTTPTATVTAAPAANPLNQSLDAIVDATRKEEKRVKDITNLAAQHIREFPLMVGEFEKIARLAIEGKSTVEQAELAFLRVRPIASGPAVIVRADSMASSKVIEAAACRAGNLEDYEKAFDPQTLQLAHDRFPRGIGLRQIFRICAKQNGYGEVDDNDDRALLHAAFTPRMGMQAAGGFSLADISGILSNIANKFLLQGFTAVDGAWRKVAATRNVKDFKTVTSYSLTGGMMYEKVGATGELKHATVGQLSYTNQADTYGRIFAITRKDIINDDLNALTKVPFKLGRGAALKLNDVFYTVFNNNTSFFASGNSNVTTGAGSALSSDALKDAVVKFRKQTDPDGLPIGVEPAVLFVPSELEIAATELMTSNLVNTGGSSTTNKVPNRNIWAQKFEVASTPYLSNSTYTGYSTTAWYLLADPQDLPVVEVAFLNGVQTPTVESADADFGSLGVQLRGFFDFGVSFVEYRGGVRAAGA